VRLIRMRLWPGLWSHLRLNHDPVRTQTERNAKRPRRPRKKARDQRAAGGSDRKQERRKYSLRRLHALPSPA